MFQTVLNVVVGQRHCNLTHHIFAHNLRSRILFISEFMQMYEKITGSSDEI